MQRNSRSRACCPAPAPFGPQSVTSSCRQRLFVKERAALPGDAWEKQPPDQVLSHARDQFREKPREPDSTGAVRRCPVPFCALSTMCDPNGWAARLPRELWSPRGQSTQDDAPSSPRKWERSGQNLGIEVPTKPHLVVHVLSTSAVPRRHGRPVKRLRALREGRAGADVPRRGCYRKSSRRRSKACILL